MLISFDSPPAVILWLGYKLIFLEGIPIILGRLGLFPLALIMAYLVMLWSNIKEGEQVGCTLRRNWRNPILYLRIFDKDGPPGIDKINFSLNMGKIVTFKYSIESDASRRLTKLGPVIGLTGKQGDRFYGGLSRFNRLEKVEWQLMV